ncbi:MAG: DUF4160 domain-containing protein [Burkholderiales bacterium]|nr:DUF4160 domain-containing protein [Burkholderiales bacterium]
MPTIAIFYGIQILMYFYDNEQHNIPHIHAEYQDFNASFSIETGEILAGKFPTKQTRIVQAWIEIHKEDLLIDWKLAINGKELMKIEPLR